MTGASIVTSGLVTGAAPSSSGGGSSSTPAPGILLRGRLNATGPLRGRIGSGP